MTLDYETIGERYEASLEPHEHNNRRKDNHPIKAHVQKDDENDPLRAEKTITSYIESMLTREHSEEEKGDQIKLYKDWVLESLKQSPSGKYPYPFYDESDLEIEGSEKRTRVTHTPTLYSAMHEGEPSVYENRREAEIELFNLLDKHIKLWKQTSDAFKRTQLIV